MTRGRMEFGARGGAVYSYHAVLLLLFTVAASLLLLYCCYLVFGFLFLFLVCLKDYWLFIQLN